MLVFAEELLFFKTLQNFGPSLLFLSACVTFLPISLGWLLAQKYFKLNPLQSLGGICGSMTSTPALGALTEKNRIAITRRKLRLSLPDCPNRNDPIHKKPYQSLDLGSSKASTTNDCINCAELRSLR
ncbi:MAG: Uncharacterised protein [Opitutia bacterium UBA7350]|nr:MAG: Uncharacterised protein [Opitutae bacterium UBA7350]